MHVLHCHICFHLCTLEHCMHAVTCFHSCFSLLELQSPRALVSWSATASAGHTRAEKHGHVDDRRGLMPADQASVAWGRKRSPIRSVSSTCRLAPRMSGARIASSTTGPRTSEHAISSPTGSNTSLAPGATRTRRGCFCRSPKPQPRSQSATYCNIAV